jgi:glycosyltransferase involved in cell wall biosynthesis
VAVFASTSGHSGVDRALGHLVPAMARRGHQVDVLQVRGHGPFFNDPPPGVRIVDLGVRNTYAALPALVRYLRRYKPQVLLTDKDKVNRLALLAKWIARVQTRNVVRLGTTVSVNLASRGWLQRQVQRLSIGRCYTLADALIVPSIGVAEDIAGYTGLSRHKIHVVPTPAIPKERFQETPTVPNHPWFERNGPPIILGVGELSKRKDFATLMRAFAIVRQQRPCRLLILGEGNERMRLSKLASDLSISNDVELRGHVTNPHNYMAHASVLGFTSRWEGMPLVLIEALASGLPIVATDCPSGPAELLQNGLYGDLVDIGDTEALAVNLLKILDNPPCQKDLQQGALPYEIEQATNQYLRTLKLPLKK